MFEKLPIPISNIVLILGVVATAWGFYEYNAQPNWHLCRDPVTPGGELR